MESPSAQTQVLVYYWYEDGSVCWSLDCEDKLTQIKRGNNVTTGVYDLEIEHWAFKGGVNG